MTDMHTIKRKKEGKKRTFSEIMRESPALDKLYEACMSNVDELIREAHILESHGCYARGFFLAHTAYEELGKAQVVADYITDCVAREEFDEAFRNHSLKSAYLNRMVQLKTEDKKIVDVTMTYDKGEGKRFAKHREHALYVSFGELYTPICPEDNISATDCQEMILHVEEQMTHIRQMEEITQRIGIRALTK